MEWLQIIISLLLFMLIIIPLGKYLYNVSTSQKMFGDKLFNVIDNFIYKVCRIDKTEIIMQ